MDSKIFEEEKGHLKDTIEYIQEDINEELREANQLLEETKEMATTDYHDKSAIGFKKRKADEIYKNVTKLEQIIDSPYFARMDLEEIDGNTAKVENLYISEELYDNKNMQIFSWTSDVCKNFYKKNASFTHDKFKYNVLLKRNFYISKGRLLEYFDDFIKSSSRDEVYDSFLLEILRQKKEIHKVTDIIKTIQENQYNIIECGLEKNIIVQGCAGSGKTIILLQRLAYQKVNNPKLDFARVAIITPSERYNESLKDIFVRLEIDIIRKFSIYDYYRHLISLYFNSQRVFKDTNQEILLNKLENFIFSENYFKLVKNNCDNWFNIFRYKNKNLVNALCKELMVSFGEIDSPWEYFNRVKVLIESFEEQYKAFEEGKRGVEDKYTRYLKYINDLKKEISNSDLYELTIKISRGTLTYLNTTLGLKENQIDTRYLVFTMLLVSYLLKGPLKEYDYILIDEGQDISLIEYKLIHLINSGTIFNIFGDTNQLISKNRGTDDWNTIKSLINAQEFRLNENYRNTEEIAKYCSQRLSINALAMGIKGSNVIKYNIHQTEEIIRSFLSNQQDERIALIYKNVEQIKAYENQLPNNIKCLSVEEAKGLEFDIVYVFPENMSRNERYVSYTRALSKLIIIE